MAVPLLWRGQASRVIGPATTYRKISPLLLDPPKILFIMRRPLAEQRQY